LERSGGRIGGGVFFEGVEEKSFKEELHYLFMEENKSSLEYKNNQL
jgi:hypothetical protein